MSSSYISVKFKWARVARVVKGVIAAVSLNSFFTLYILRVLILSLHVNMSIDNGNRQNSHFKEWKEFKQLNALCLL